MLKKTMEELRARIDPKYLTEHIKLLSMYNLPNRTTGKLERNKVVTIEASLELLEGEKYIKGIGPKIIHSIYEALQNLADGKQHMSNDGRTADPTPQEILDRCEEIKKTWDEQETRKRSSEELRPVELRIFKHRDLFPKG